MNTEDLPRRGSERDIEHHGALVRFADLVADTTLRAPMIYLDPMAFAVNAPVYDRLEWMQAVDSQLAESPYYTSYVKTQKRALDETGLYRCPVGLVSDTIEATSHRCLFAEPDDDFRKLLRNQLDEQFIRYDALEPSIEALEQLAPIDAQDEDYDVEDIALLTYLEYRDSASRDQIERDIEVASVFCAEDSFGLIQIALRDGEFEDRPSSPDGFEPAISWNAEPATSVVYATEKLTRRARHICDQLAWHTADG